METPLRLPTFTSIVFDTNVLISAFIFKKFSGELYQYCAEQYVLYSSVWMLDELSRKLGSKKFGLPMSVQGMILTQVKADINLISPTNQLPTDSRDPDDNNVLQVALFVEAHFLITGDRDLLDLGQIDDTEIVSPKAFYERYIA